MSIEKVGTALHGAYHDILRDKDGAVIWERNHSNTILEGCRYFLSALMRGDPGCSAGIIGLQVGMGKSIWDLPPGAPSTSTGQTSLHDPHPYMLPSTQLKFRYLEGSSPVSNPTNRLQIVAEMGPGTPSWPDADHTTVTLREFGLVAKIGNQHVLLNYVSHPAIIKDPFSTLERTIWLVF